ncbi:hypothetical protein CB1_001310008 [Camelus ferus]|nr:hypothetical protein CB1_001310008 [Camelus ferus]
MGKHRLILKPLMSLPLSKHPLQSQRPPAKQRPISAAALDGHSLAPTEAGPGSEKQTTVVNTSSKHPSKSDPGQADLCTGLQGPMVRTTARSLNQQRLQESSPAPLTACLPLSTLLMGPADSLPQVSFSQLPGHTPSPYHSYSVSEPMIPKHS